MDQFRRQEGFTLIEMILVVAIIALLAGFGVPIYYSFLAKNDLEVAAGTTTQLLRRAQLNSQAMVGDSSWGVKVQNSGATLFKGTSYSAVRDTSGDEVFSFANNLIVSDLTEILFTKFTGVVSTVGTTTLTLPSGELKNITINSQGVVNY